MPPRLNNFSSQGGLDSHKRKQYTYLQALALQQNID